MEQIKNKILAHNGAISFITIPSQKFLDNMEKYVLFLFKQKNIVIITDSSSFPMEIKLIAFSTIGNFTLMYHRGNYITFDESPSTHCIDTLVSQLFDECDELYKPKSTPCVICCEPSVTDAVCTNCGKQVCTKCADKVGQKCPFCRFDNYGGYFSISEKK
jgi:hypothetical protein